MTLLTRYQDDQTAPTLLAVGRDLIIRALLPALALFTVGLGVGWVLVGPIGSSPAEDQLSVLAQSARTPVLDTIALTASAIGSVNGNAIICLLSVALVWIVSRRWWLAALPAVALALHVMVHLATSTLVARPRPQVETLDIGQPTASFPSGHMGATTAQLLVVVLFLFHRVASQLWRSMVTLLATGYLLVLGWSRVYLGMHHLSDVLWGAVNGVACGLIAWFFLRRDPVVGADAITFVRDAPG
ncbi:MAG TPA: phosphatase PAP2 family protein [Propionicimonas sp.]|jgi:undecaprenyl-diphosphatase